MKTFLLYSVIIVVTFFSSCKHAIDSLPELEASKADSIKKLKGYELWATAASFREKPVPVTTGSMLLIPPDCATIRAFRIRIFYSITICRRPDYFVKDNEMMALFEGNDSTVRQINSQAVIGAYRLSASKVRNLNQAIWCRQDSGPWVAEVTEEQSCANADLYKTTVKLTGISEMISWEWNGRFDERFADFGIETFDQKFGFMSSRTDCNSADLTKCNP